MLYRYDKVVTWFCKRQHISQEALRVHNITPRRRTTYARRSGLFQPYDAAGNTRLYLRFISFSKLIIIPVILIYENKRYNADTVSSTLKKSVL